MANISQGSILQLKALTAEHVDRFAKEGKKAIKGQPRNKVLTVNHALLSPAFIQLMWIQTKDPFAKPSPGLVKRLAAEARNDAKRRHFQDEAGPSDEQRRANMEMKAKKYDAMRRGDYSGMNERELAEGVIDVCEYERCGLMCSLRGSRWKIGRIIVLMWMNLL
jgi:hypothetical protein